MKQVSKKYSIKLNIYKKKIPKELLFNTLSVSEPVGKLSVWVKMSRNSVFALTGSTVY